jgi:hypothetical protein
VPVHRAPAVTRRGGDRDRDDPVPSRKRMYGRDDWERTWCGECASRSPNVPGRITGSGSLNVRKSLVVAYPIRLEDWWSVL